MHCPGLTTPKQQELQQSVVVYTCELFNFSLKTAHILFEVFAIDGKCFLIVVYSQGLLMPVPASYTKGSSVLSPCPMALNPAKSFADTSWVYTKFGLRLALIGSIACVSQIDVVYIFISNMILSAVFQGLLIEIHNLYIVVGNVGVVVA